MKGELFSHEVQRTSAVFGRKQDVTVVFQGDGAATDGSTIYLPSIDHNADVTDEQADVMRGYVDHEAGHVRHTNFAVAKKFMAECERDGNVLLRSLANALEDIWLEKRVRDEYPGSEKNLRATATAVNKQFLADIEPTDPRLADDRFITPVALTWEGRKDYGGETCTQCLDLLPADLRRQLGVWIDAVNACRNTKDVIALARTIEHELAEGDYRDDDRPVHGTPAGGTGTPDGDGPTGDGGDGNDDGDGGSHEGASGERPDGEGTSGDGSQGGDSDGDTDADSEAPRGHGDAPDGDGDVAEKSGDDVYTAFDLKDAVEREFREGGHLTCGEGSYRPLSTAHDKWHHRTDSESKYPTYPFGHAYMNRGTAAEYDAELRNMAGDINVMRRKLERALMAKQQRDWDYAQENGRLDSRRFTAAFAGRTNVFKMRSDSNEIDTALTILVDLSGSMCGMEAYIAQQCSIAMAESIDRTGIRYEVLGFNNRSGYERTVVPPKARRGSYYSRTEPLDMYVFKAFEERLFEAKGAMVTMVHCAGGNNSDGEAIVHAYNRLNARPESRKVMIVISDGMPSSGGIKRHLRQHTRDAVQLATDNGVDCVGIGICTDAVSRFYPKYTVINDVNELASTGMDNLARALMGERFQVDNSKLLDAKKTA